MAIPEPRTDYLVRVAHNRGRFELSIPELMILVRSNDLEEAYRSVLETKAEVLDWAQKTGTLGNLPHPLPA